MSKTCSSCSALFEISKFSHKISKQQCYFAMPPRQKRDFVLQLPFPLSRHPDPASESVGCSLHDRPKNQHGHCDLPSSHHHFPCQYLHRQGLCYFHLIAILLHLFLNHRLQEYLKINQTTIQSKTESLAELYNRQIFRNRYWGLRDCKQRRGYH